MHNPYKNKHRIPLVKNKQDVIKEIQKCRDSFEYFLLTYCYVKHQFRGAIKLDEYPYLFEIVRCFLTYRYLVINKGRQLGVSTVTALYNLWIILFHNGKNTLTIATKAEVSKNIISIMRFALARLPKWMTSGLIISDNKQSISISNDSKAESIPTTEDAGRSNALYLLVIDEAAHIKAADPEIVWSAAFNCLSTGGRAIILSSPNGASGWFYRICMGAIAGTNDFHYLELKWNVHPLRDQKWRDDQDRQLGKKLALQENDADFISSGDSIIDSEVLGWYKKIVQAPIDKSLTLDKMFWVYKGPISGHRYIISADVARGDAGSKSAFVVIDIDEMEIVADYSYLMLPTNFGQLLVEAARLYNDALLIPENNNIGPMAIQAIIDADYPNLYYTLKASDQIIDPINIPKGLLLDQIKIAGFITSGKTRHLIVEKMVQVVENKILKIPSERLINQLYSFKMIAGKPKADKGCNDDLVLALAIGLWNTDISLKLSCMKQQLTQAMLNSTAKITASLNTPGAMLMQNKINSQENFNHYYLMPIGKQQGNDVEYINLYDMLIRTSKN